MSHSTSNSTSAPAFPWNTAAKIAWREVRSAVPKFAFVIIAVALGVGALTGVRSFSRSFRAMLLTQARSLMAGDIALNVSSQSLAAPPPLLAALAQSGVRHTVITESVSMVGATASGNPVLTTVKAVDAAVYPFDGQVETTPPGALATLDDHSALVAPDLLLRLHLNVGDSLSIGGQPFRIAATLDSEPDRLEGGISIGPRLIVTHAGLTRTGIIQFGSQVQNRIIFKLAPAAAPLATVEAQLRDAYPQARMQDYRSVNPTVQEGLDHSTTFLSLISLMALIVGALGVASAMHAHLQLRMDSIATMKVLGARTSQILRIYGLQTFLLGLVGGVLGVGLSALIERVFPHLLLHFFPNMPPVGWSWGPALQGLAIGVLITMLFTLPTLLGVRHVPPAVIIRRYMSESGQPWRKRASRIAEVAFTGLLIFAGVALIAVALVDAGWNESFRTGGLFLVALVFAIAILAAVTWALLRLLRLVVKTWSRTGRMPTALRHGFANLYRPGSQAQPVLVALGIGVMFTLGIYLLQRALLADLSRSTPPGVSNVFLIDIPPQQADGVLNLLQRQAGLITAPELLKTVSVKMQSINGADLPTPAPRALPGQSRGAGEARGGGDGRGGEARGGGGFGGGEPRGGGGFRARARVQRNFNLSTAATLPDSGTLASGAWWTGTPASPQIAISDDQAQALRLHVGDTLGWTTATGATFTTHLAAIYIPQPHRIIARVDFLVSPGPLDALPVIINGGVRVQPGQIPALERNLYALYPTVTVVDLAAIIERVQEVVDQIALVVHFVSFFAVLAGAIILASSVAGTRFRRMREIAILKTFGATRGRIIRIFSTEFLLLGAVAGLTGCLLAIAFTNLITQRLLQVPFHIDLWPNLICVVATALVAALAGWLASARILQQKPLDVLRGE